MNKLIQVLLVSFLVFFYAQAHAQLPDTVTTKWVGLTPLTKHTKIKALAVGLSPTFGLEGELYIKINGVNLELGPMGIIGGIWGTMFGLAGIEDSAGLKHSFFSPRGYTDTSELRYLKYATRINGLSVSIGGISVRSLNNGVFINGLASMNYSSNGIQVTGLINDVHQFNGIMIGGIANKAQKGNGMMIGLINNAETGNLLQIGLFNRIGHRVIPLVNCGFR